MKRYAIINYDRIGNSTPGCLEEYVFGQLVKYEDCKSIKEENDKLKARVAELEGLVRDIKQNDINEAARRILGGGLKLNYSLPLSIRERIAAALKEPANEG